MTVTYTEDSRRYPTERYIDKNDAGIQEVHIFSCH